MIRYNYNWYGMHRYWSIYEWTWEPLTWDVYTQWAEKPMTATRNDEFEVEMLELPYYSSLWYKIRAVDNAGNSLVSETYRYNVVNGNNTIIYTQVSEVTTWVLYISVGLVLVRGLGREKAAEGGPKG